MEGGGEPCGVHVLGCRVTVDNKPELPLHVANEFMQPIVKIAALVTGICAIAYICGWAYLHRYFAEAGAPWVVEMLPIVSVMQAPMPAALVIASIVVILMFIRSINGADGFDSKKAFAGMTWGGIALIAVLIAHAVFAIFGGGSYAIFEAIEFALGALWLVLSTAHSYLSVAEGSRTAREEIFSSYAFIAFIIFSSGLYLVGVTNAGRDFDLSESKLPKVALSDSSERDWRLVRAIDGQSFLIVRLAEKPRPHAFRIVETGAIESVTEFKSADK